MRLSETRSQLIAQLAWGVLLALLFWLMFNVRVDTVAVFGIKIDVLLPWGLAAVSLASGVVHIVVLAGDKRPVTLFEAAVPMLLAAMAMQHVQSFALEAAGFVALGLNGAVVILLVARRMLPRNTK